MTTAATHPMTDAPPPLEVPGPVTVVPSLDELERLTAIPDRRVVFRRVDWDFYEALVDSIPEWRKIHVDYDGKDLEIVRYCVLYHRYEEERTSDSAWARRPRAEIRERAGTKGV